MAKVKIQVTLEQDLLDRIEAYAERNGLSRSSMMAYAATQLMRTDEAISSMASVAASMRRIADSGEISEQDRKQLEQFEAMASLLTTQR